MDGNLKGIFTVLEGVDKNKFCHLCSNKMDISSVSSKIMKNIFGDENYGFWMCPNHDGKKYYPNPLKKSTIDKSMAGFREMGAAYVQITNNRFPWKCPICTNVLKYRDERYEHLIC
jgi:hypothetical protein